LDSNSVWFSRKKSGIPDTCLENQREQNSLEIQKKASSARMQHRSGIPDNCLENQTKQISLVNQTMSGKPDMKNWSGFPDIFFGLENQMQNKCLVFRTNLGGAVTGTQKIWSGIPD